MILVSPLSFGMESSAGWTARKSPLPSCATMMPARSPGGLEGACRAGDAGARPARRTAAPSANAAGEDDMANLPLLRGSITWPNHF
jgi:hypothetical protein